MTVEDLLREARELPREDQLRLLDQLGRLLLGPSQTMGPATDLCGVGRELHDGTDAQDYVNRERDSWTG